MPTKLKAEVKREFEVVLGSVSGIRERLQDDSGVRQAIIEYFKKHEYEKDNKYFVIRETIATKELDFSSKTNWIAGINVSAEIKKLVDADAHLNWDDKKSFSLIKKFKTPLRIWYRAEEIEPKEVLGVGPSGVLRFNLVEAAPDALKLSIEQQPNNP